MSWYRLRSGKGEVRYAASLDGEDTALWTPLAITRCPEPFETVADDGTISTDATLKNELEDETRIDRLTKRAMLLWAIRTAKSQMIDDLQAVGVVTAAKATQLRGLL